MSCQICGSKLKSLGTIPFDKNGANVEIVDDTPFEYHQCTECSAIFCLEMLTWSSEKFSEKVYNADYVKIDPAYLDERPINYADFLNKHLGPLKKYKHLDYGCGAGIMCKILREKGWDSVGYDPFSHNVPPNEKFKFITAIEVIEHSQDLDKTIKDVKQYLHRDGVFLFSTLLADRKTDIDWWYLCVRGGHINIQSEKSLKIVAKNNGMSFSSLADNVHIMQRTRNNLKGLFHG
jgi:2-polyprenyl-3-methyl-5-hydroxy-6-metoxy-1,4-benzoquinol methylase